MGGRKLIAVLALALAVLAGCNNGPRAGDKCNHAGAKSNGLVCKRNNHSTGPLVWRRS